MSLCECDSDDCCADYFIEAKDIVKMLINSEEVYEGVQSKCSIRRFRVRNTMYFCIVDIFMHAYKVEYYRAKDLWEKFKKKHIDTFSPYEEIEFLDSEDRYEEKEKLECYCANETVNIFFIGGINEFDEIITCLSERIFLTVLPRLTPTTELEKDLSLYVELYSHHKNIIYRAKRRLVEAEGMDRDKVNKIFDYTKEYSDDCW